MTLASCAASAASYDAFAGIDLTGDSVPFSAVVKGAVNSAFSDVFGFVIPSSYNVDSGLQSTATLSGKKTFDLDITSFGIRNTATNTIYNGTKISTGKVDSWSISSQNLGVGSYQLFVGGTVLGTGGGSYGGNLNISPVPEPETYLMMLGGLLVVGIAATRRRQPFGGVPV